MLFLKAQQLNKFLKLRNKNILLLTSNYHLNKKYFSSIQSLLKKKNKLDIYSEIKPGAQIKDLNFILKNFNKPDYIIGLGGGSVMDISKACSCLFEKKIKKNYINLKFSKKIFTLLIPTILGTGAESSVGSILQKKNKTKFAIRHKLIKANKIIVDCDIVKLASTKHMSEALYDCLSHAIETFLSKFSNKIVQNRSLKVIREILAFKNKNIFKKVIELKKIARFSYLMGLNLAASTTCLPHRIQYSMSKYTNSSHAQCIIALHKGWLKVLNDKKNEEYFSLSKKLYQNENQLTKNIIRFKKIFNIDFNLKVLKVKKKNFTHIIKSVSGNLFADPIYNSKKEIKTILSYSL
jgi:alcohol dehydrogenase class IV